MTTLLAALPEPCSTSELLETEKARSDQKLGEEILRESKNNQYGCRVNDLLCPGALLRNNLTQKDLSGWEV